MTPTPVNIPLSKAKLIKLLIFCILFLIVGIWMLVTQPQTGNPVFNSPILKNAAAVICVVMCPLGIVFFCRKLLDKRPGIVIDSLGIIDNSSALSAGHIPWADITDIRQNTVQTGSFSKQKFITIVLRNPEDYIARETSVIKRKAMSAGLKYSGSPISISANGLKIKFEELDALLQEKFREYRHR